MSVPTSGKHLSSMSTSHTSQVQSVGCAWPPRTLRSFKLACRHQSLTDALLMRPELLQNQRQQHPGALSGRGVAVLAALVVMGTQINGSPAYAGAAQTAPGPGIVIQGPARVVDGDTLEVDGKKIRLYGLDAPEKAQACRDAKGSEYPCGLVSRDALAAKLSGQGVRCTVRNLDQYGRNVASCNVSNGEDVGKWLVSEGYAVAYRQYGKEYVAVEDAAHGAGRGIWRGTFQVPSEWRKQQKAIDTALVVAPVPQQASLPEAAASSAVSSLLSKTSSAVQLLSCPQPAIKGNISKSGEKVYHMPGGKYYATTKIDVDDGERYFCTEAEAQAAGWRAAR